MFLSVKRIPHPIPPADRPDPKAAQALQEGLEGQFGEMRTMMQPTQPDDLPLSVALDSPNIHHFLVAAQSARPVDAAGNQGQHPMYMIVEILY